MAGMGKHGGFIGDIMIHKTQPFNVYRFNRVIDTIFYNVSDNVSSDEVKKSMINHDGYPSDIEVKKVRL